MQQGVIMLWRLVFWKRFVFKVPSALTEIEQKRFRHIKSTHTHTHPRGPQGQPWHGTEETGLVFLRSLRTESIHPVYHTQNCVRKNFLLEVLKQRIYVIHIHVYIYVHRNTHTHTHTHTHAHTHKDTNLICKILFLFSSYVTGHSNSYW